MSYQPKNWYWCKYRQRDTAKRYGQERAYTVLPSRNWKEHEMKQDYEGQGLERFFRALWVFAGIGVVSVLGWAGYALYALWKGLT